MDNQYKKYTNLWSYIEEYNQKFGLGWGSGLVKFRKIEDGGAYIVLTYLEHLQGNGVCSGRI